MAKFNPSKVQPIDYDFQAIPRFDFESDDYVEGEYCRGKGRVREPRGEDLQKVLDVTDQIKERTLRDQITIQQARQELTDLFAETLQIPREHIDELPPRHFHEFRDFLVLELWNVGNG